MTLPGRDDARVGWTLPDGTFVSDAELYSYGIKGSGKLSPEAIWEAITDELGRSTNTFPNGLLGEGERPPEEKGAGWNVIQMVPRSGPGREAAAEELRIRKLEIIEALARGNVKAMAEAAPRDIEVGPIEILNPIDGIQATVFIKVSENLPRIRLTQIFEWEE